MKSVLFFAVAMLMSLSANAAISFSVDHLETAYAEADAQSDSEVSKLVVLKVLGQNPETVSLSPKLIESMLEDLAVSPSAMVRLEAGRGLILVWKKLSTNSNNQKLSDRINNRIVRSFLIDKNPEVRERLFSLMTNPIAGEPSLFIRPDRPQDRNAEKLAAHKTGCMERLFNSGF